MTPTSCTAWAPFTLLLDHFEIPDVPDVGGMKPEGFRRNMESLNDLQTGLAL